jgi:hypothetical protein
VIRRRKRPRPIRKGHEGRKVCDALWSELIRKKAGGRCERLTLCLCRDDGSIVYRLRCGNVAYLQAHHPVSRGRRATRHDPDNGIALCRGCHFWVHNHLPASRAVEWYAAHGIDLPELERRASVRGYRPDYALVEVGLRAMIGGEVELIRKGRRR